jgi:capsular polysaccharide biosynthesis protein
MLIYFKLYYEKNDIYESKKVIWVIGKNGVKDNIVYKELDAGLSVASDYEELLISDELLSKTVENIEKTNNDIKLPSISSLKSNTKIERKLNSRVMTIKFRNSNKKLVSIFLEELLNNFKIEAQKIIGYKNIFVIGDYEVTDETKYEEVEDLYNSLKETKEN